MLQKWFSVGEKTKVKIVKIEKEEKTFKLLCRDCDKSFINQQGSSVHLLRALPNGKNDFITKRRELAVKAVVDNVKKKVLKAVVQKIENPDREITDVIKAALPETVDNVAKTV